MMKLARHLMTPNPACCRPNTTLDQVAKMMVQNDCGEILIIDVAEHPVGVVTDRDIVCRVVAEGKNPMAYTAEICMSGPVVTVTEDASLGDVVMTMAKYQLRRVPVIDEAGRCTGLIAQSDVARVGSPNQVGAMVREVSRTPGDLG